LLYDKITCYEIYKDITIEVDMFNHTYLPQAPQNLDQFLIVTEKNRGLTVNEVNQLYRNCIEVTRNAFDKTKDFREKDYVKKTIQMRYEWLKPALKSLNIEPSIPRSVFALCDKVAEAKNAHQQFIMRMRSEMPGLSASEAISKITEMFLSSIYRE